MSSDRNQEEWTLLRLQPGELLLRYQSIIGFTVDGFIRRGFFSAAEREELIQEINLAMLERKLARIAQHYDGSVYLRTYFGQVVYRLCIEHGRRRPQVSFVAEEALEQTAGREPDPAHRALLADEARRLDAILRLLPKAYKSRLCLKAWARLLITWLDVQLYDAPPTRGAILAIKEKLFGPYDDLTELEVFTLLAALFNRVENKEGAPDSLRRWTTELAGRVVAALNGTPPTAAYQPETLKILLAYVEKMEA